MNITNISFILEITQCVIIFLYFIHTFTNAKVKRLYYILLIVVYTLILFSEYLSISYITIWLLHLFVYLILPIVSIQNIRIASNLYTSLLVVGIVSFVNSCISFIVSVLDLNGITNELVGLAIKYICIIVMILLINTIKVKSIIMDMMTASKNVRIVILAFIWELFFLNVLQNTILSMNFGNRINLTVGGAIFVTAVVSCIVIQLLISNNIQSSYYKRLNVTMENNVRQQIRHYQQMSKIYEDLRKFKHDFNNMIIGLNLYLRQGDTEFAKAYLEKFTNKSTNEYTAIHTGNSLVDSMLTDKLDYAWKHNVDIDFEGFIPEHTIDPIDLCIIFGNTLDNAIEACSKIKEKIGKTIIVTVKKNRDMFFVKIANPVDRDVKIINNTVSTTKQDAFSHGIGLYSIRKVVEKYNGNMKIECKQQLFSIEMEFVLEKEDLLSPKEEILTC